MVAKSLNIRDFCLRYKRGATSGMGRREEEDQRDEDEAKDSAEQRNPKTAPEQAGENKEIPNLSDVQSVLLDRGFSSKMQSAGVAEKAASVLRDRGFDVKAVGTNLEHGDTGRKIQIYKRPSGEWAARMR